MAGEYIEFDNNNQPAVNDTNLNRLQQLIKQDIQGAVSGDTLSIGTIVPFGSNTVPENWLLCDGSAVSRTQYQDLFNIIGTTFGQGDGFTTFNLPDLRDRVPVGKDSNDTDFGSLGNTGGEKEHTLTVEEMPSHSHMQFVGANSGSWGVRSDYNSDGNCMPYDQGNTGTTGGGEAHNILQPYIVTNYIIKAFQSSGVVATVIDNLNSTSVTDALSANQGNVLGNPIEKFQITLGSAYAYDTNAVNQAYYNKITKEVTLIYHITGLSQGWQSTNLATLASQYAPSGKLYIPTGSGVTRSFIQIDNTGAITAWLGDGGGRDIRICGSYYAD